MILMGAIAGVHGIRGEVKVKSFTEDPMSIAAAPGFMRVRFCGIDELVFGMASPPMDREGLGRASSSFS